MQRVVGALLYIFVSLYGTLLASEVKVLEPNEAIRLIGNRGVVFVSADDNESYNDDYIVGSVNISAKNIRYQDDNGTLTCVAEYICPKEAKSLLEDRGIKDTQTIIIYDQFDGVNASGLYSFFEAIGHKDIKILNGGLESIRLLDPNQKLYDKLQQEYEDIKIQLDDIDRDLDPKVKETLLSDMDNVVAKINIIKPSLLTHHILEEKEQKSQYQPKEEMMDLSNIASTHEVRQALSDMEKMQNKSQFVIIDTRDASEIEGGQIPFSIAIESKNFTDFTNKKSFKSPQEIQEIVDSFGIKKDQTIYIYSNYSAGRGSHVALALRIIGYENVKVFAGGWSSWSDDNQSEQD